MAEAILPRLIAEANSQLQAYRSRRQSRPDAFGHAGGFFDGTPDTGPMPLFVIYSLGSGEYGGTLLWGIHKHPWPLDYWYCTGSATDSRGERTTAALQFDVRELPRAYIGRYKLQLRSVCDRRSHISVIGRALADGFDLRRFAVQCNAERERQWQRDEVARRARVDETDDGVPF